MKTFLGIKMGSFDSNTGKTIEDPGKRDLRITDILIIVALSPLIILSIIKNELFGNCWNGHKGLLSKGW